MRTLRVRRGRTYGGEADLIAFWDVEVWGDLLGDGVGYRQGFETTEGQGGEKGEAKHGGLLISEFVNSKVRVGPASRCRCMG